MSKVSWRRHLRNRLLDLNSQIAVAERQSERSEPSARVKLAAEAKILHERREEIEVLLDKLDNRPDGVLSNIGVELAEGAADISLAIRRWFDKH